jgi:putative Mn2+ efflux pump MntP
MSTISVIILAIGLAMDATAVAVATSISLGRVDRRQVFRFAFHFGFFQAVMPIVGWLTGRGLHSHIRQWDHWVAFGLLALIGFKAIKDAWRSEDDVSHRDPTRGWSLVILSLATSIDALAVGLSLVVLGISIWYPCVIIGLVTAVMTTLGMLAGARLGSKTGHHMKAFGGIILLAIGIKILLEHLLE